MIENGQWIACPEEAEVPVIRKAFMLEKPEKGCIEITGLGFFTLFINGQRVTEDCFTPALTDYQPRETNRWNYPLFDETTHRILYLTYDLTPYVRDGENVLEVQLAPGWYRQNERACEGKMSFGKQLKAVFAAEFSDADGKKYICSDGTETWTPSEILFSNLYIGEVHDARLLGEAQEPRPVEVIEAPESELTLQTCPPDRVIRIIRPKLLGTVNGKQIYDLGENTTIRVRVAATGQAGDKIRLRFAENLDANGEAEFHSTGSYYKRPNKQPQIQEDVFICNGKSHTFRSEYVWHACRYIEVEGSFDELTAEVVHTDAAVISEFHSSNEILNWIYDAYLRTQLGNLHNCIPSDCPHRERLGYTGDGQIVAKTAMLTLDMKDVYRKWIRDIMDGQDITSGHIQHTAPLMGGGGGPGGWGCAMVIIPDEYDKHYDDEAFLAECYPAMQGWIMYLRNHTENDLVVREEPKGWCLGDWATLYPIRIPEPYVNTCYLADALRRMVRIARRLGRTQDARAYEAYGRRVKKAIRDKYYDRGTGSFCGGVQGADVYAVWAEVTEDDRTLKNLAKRYDELGYFDTGFLGTAILVNVLMHNGYEDIAYQLLTNEHTGSYANMKAHGATTLWEHFDGRASHNHPMFGGVVQNFFDGFLGIGQAEGGVGYRSLIIAPKIPEQMQQASGSTVLPCGEVRVGWQKNNGTLTIRIAIPDVPAVCRICGETYELRCGDNTITVAG